MKRILISLLLCPLTMMAMQHRQYTMRSQPDNDRRLDLTLTWHILSENIAGLPDSDPRVIASYQAIFRNCNNGILNLAPATAIYIKNPNGYTLTPIIQSMASEKHLLSTVSLQYTTEKDGKKTKDQVRLEFSGKSPLVYKDPTNQNLYMRILLSEIKTHSDEK
jgi:hypothetical protein